MDGAQAQPGEIRLIMPGALQYGLALRRGLFCEHVPAYLDLRKDVPMPLNRLLVLLCAVIVAAGATVWLLTLGSPGLLVAALPAFLIAAAAILFLRR